MIMTRLKQETLVYHMALEQSLPLQLLMSETVSLDIYRAILRKFYGFHLPLEERMAYFLPEWGALHFDFEARRKVKYLEQDLRLLADDPMVLPVCQDLPALGSFPQALGCLYVLEGSTLGGQFITRHLHHCLNLSHLHYFSSYGENVGSMWKIFGSTLTQYVKLHGCEDQIVTAANETFIELGEWLMT